MNRSDNYDYLTKGQKGMLRKKGYCTKNEVQRILRG